MQRWYDSKWFSTWTELAQAAPGIFPEVPQFDGPVPLSDSERASVEDFIIWTQFEEPAKAG